MAGTAERFQIRRMAAFGGASIPSGMLIDAVVRPLQAAFTPMRVHKGGSEAKNTCTETSDIDLVVVLHDFDHAEVKRYCDFRALEAFRTAAREVRVEILSYTNHGMKVRAALVGSWWTTLRADILFTGDRRTTTRQPSALLQLLLHGAASRLRQGDEGEAPAVTRRNHHTQDGRRERVDTDSAAARYFCELLHQAL